MTTAFDTALSRWLGEVVDFGGEKISRADVYRWFEEQGYPRRAAELWLIGNARVNA